MSLSVAILGHSQVPIEFKSYKDIEVTLFRKPGALLKDINNYPLNKIWQHNFDIIIIFLGGNDAVNNTTQYITDTLIKLVERCQSITKQVLVTKLEKRYYPTGSKYTHKDFNYLKICKAVNRNLSKRAKQLGFRTLDFTSPLFTHSRDGVHFTRETQDRIIQHFKVAIQKTRDSWNQ